MSLLNFLSTAITPVMQGIDALVTSDEERLTIKAQLYEMQASLMAKTLDYEAGLLEARSSIIEAEAQGQGWLQRSWRPITMLTFLVLVVADSFGWLPNQLAPEAWNLLQIGLGGYVAGRSAEKIAPQVLQVFRERGKEREAG